MNFGGGGAGQAIQPITALYPTGLNFMSMEIRVEPYSFLRLKVELCINLPNVAECMTEAM